MGSFAEALREYTINLLKKRKIDLRTRTSVKEVQLHNIILSDGTSIPYGACIWSTGMAATPLVKSLRFEKDKSERLIVNEYLQVKDYDDVYALGDCASTGLPQTAQVAQQQAKYLAKSLNLLAKGQKPKPFKYNHIFSLAYVGGWKGLVDDSKNVRVRGFLAFLVWRAAYITKTVGLQNKMLIPMFWLKSWLFGRDITRF